MWLVWLFGGCGDRGSRSWGAVEHQKMLLFDHCRTDELCSNHWLDVGPREDLDCSVPDSFLACVHLNLVPNLAQPHAYSRWSRTPRDIRDASYARAAETSAIACRVARLIAQQGLPVRAAGFSPKVPQHACGTSFVSRPLPVRQHTEMGCSRPQYNSISVIQLWLLHFAFVAPAETQRPTPSVESWSGRYHRARGPSPPGF